MTLRSSQTQRAIGRFLTYCDTAWSARFDIIAYVADLLSKLRAMAVRRELVKSGVVLRDVRGFGAEMPVAANSEDEGRIRNRRVEVWVY